MEVMEVLEEVEKMDIRLDWFDNVIGGILKVEDHHKVAQKSIL